MSYSDRTSPAQLIGAIIGFLVLGLIVRVVWAGGIEEYFVPSKQVENRIEEALQAQPGDLAILQSIETYFPDDYDDLLEAMADAGMAGADDAQVIEAGNRQLASFLGNHRNDFAAAPSDALTAVLTSETSLIEALHFENPLACSNHVFGTVPPATEPSEEVKLLIGQAVATKVRAMAAGRTDQQMRLPPSSRDFSLLADAMIARGASKAEAAIALQGIESTVHDFDLNELCGTAILMVEAIGDLDPFVRDQMIGAMLARRDNWPPRAPFAQRLNLLSCKQLQNVATADTRAR